MKHCKVCGELKPLMDYYKHPGMADGHLGKCKECHKAFIRKNREENVERYREHDRNRSNESTRLSARKAYLTTEAGKAASSRAKLKHRSGNPVRVKAMAAVRRAVINGKLAKLPCWCCGKEEVEGHHPAYSMPLDVIWLCTEHHDELHLQHNEFERTYSQTPPD